MSGETLNSAPPGREPPAEPAATASRRHALMPWLCAAVGCAVVLAGFLGLDRWFYTHVSCALNSEVLSRDFYHVTRPFWELCRCLFAQAWGGAIAYAAILLLHPKGRLYAQVGLVAVLAAALVASGGQRIIGRVRPNQVPTHGAFFRPFEGLAHSEPTCFPSGEATMAFALAGVLVRLFPRWRAVFYAGAALGAGARLVNGAHFLSDVAAGALLGSLAAWVVMRWAAKHEARLETLIAGRTRA